MKSTQAGNGNLNKALRPVGEKSGMKDAVQAEAPPPPSKVMSKAKDPNHSVPQQLRRSPYALRSKVR